MDSNTVKAQHVFLLLLIFWCAWLYTEITEYVKRDNFSKEVKAFMHKGDRFTIEDGEALEERIKQLEAVDNPAE